MVAEEVSGGNDEVHFQFRAEKLDKKVSPMALLWQIVHAVFYNEIMMEDKQN